jgi:secondary thiamine-phosphate synthase enzyme
MVRGTLSPLTAPAATSARGSFPAEMWAQRRIVLKQRPRGVHIVTRELIEAVPEIAELSMGMVNLFIQHTSASLALNENASPDVRRDLETWLDRIAPDGAPFWTHVLEGPDDMPAHVKSVIVGESLMIPVSAGHLALGTWQGVYLCEHRDHGGPRSVMVTVWGDEG